MLSILVAFSLGVLVGLNVFLLISTHPLSRGAGRQATRLIHPAYVERERVPAPQELTEEEEIAQLNDFQGRIA